MTKANGGFPDILDKIIFGFMLVFLVSLTNSIFVNQIGYFGALFFILVKVLYLRKNIFPRTGLELAFILFIAVEIISTILSDQPGDSFRNLLKRALLIPVFYTVIVAADTPGKGKLFVRTYLIAAVLTVLLYIFFSYEHFISHLYQLESKGPSPFQYVMTAGGLISFTTVYFFAFFIKEKSKLFLKVLYLAGFMLSGLALLLSYTRAAWVGAAAAIILILILTRKWYYLVPLILALVLAVFLYPGESQVRIYRLNGNNLEIRKIFETEGKAYSVYRDSNFTMIADFNKGLLVGSDEGMTEKFDTDGMTSVIEKWRPGIFFTINADTRVRIFELEASGGFSPAGELMTPGIFSTFGVFNGELIIADSDSGVTFFHDPFDPSDFDRIKGLAGITSFAADSSLFVAYRRDLKKLLFYEMTDELIPGDTVGSFEIETDMPYIKIVGDEYYFFYHAGLKVYSRTGKGIHLINDLSEPGEVINVFPYEEGKYFLLTINKQLMEAEILAGGKIKITGEFKLDYQPSDITYDSGMLYTSHFKTNRILSMVSPFHLTNIERINQWETGLRILKENPLFGVGDIDLMEIYGSHKKYYEKLNFGHLHNNFVHILVILGIFGFAAFIFLLWKILRLNIRIYSSLKGSDFYSAFSLGTLAAFVGFVFSGLAEWNFGDHEIITMVWFVTGMNYAFYKLLVIDKIGSEN